MPYLRDTAIILKHEPFREHDARIIFYGREHGKLVAVARGAERAQAKHLGHLEPLTEVDVMIAKGASFDKVAVARRRGAQIGLRRNMAGLTVAAGVAELTDSLTRPGVAEPAVYRILAEALDIGERLEAEPSPERARLLLSAAGLKLLDATGYAPSLEACSRCRAPLTEQAWLAERLDGLLCERCAPAARREDPGLRPLVPHTVRLLRFLRQAALAEALRVTAAAEIFLDATAVVISALRATPLEKEPRAFTTVPALLAPLH